VKILQALRNKSGTNAMNTLPKKVDDNLVKPANQASVVKPSPAVVPPSAQKPVEVVDPKYCIYNLESQFLNLQSTN